MIHQSGAAADRASIEHGSLSLENPQRSGTHLGVIAILVLGVMYLLLLNGFWVPGGDSEVYTAAARSIVRGDGFLFNGSPVAISPPGWPYVLAGAMWILPEFWFLKSLNIVGFLAFFFISFQILRHWVSPSIAALAVLLSGMLGTVYPLTYWLHSEAMFCSASIAAWWFALRISEGRGKALSMVALVLMLVIAGVTRWQGLLNLLPVTAILLQGVPWRASLLRWVAVLFVWVACIATFWTTYRSLELSAEEASAAQIAGGGADQSSDESMTATPPANPEGRSNPLLVIDKSQPSDSLTAEYIHRFVNAGHWISWLVWPPARFAHVIEPARAVGLLAGWLALILLTSTMIRSIQLKNWFWIGLALYVGVMMMNWNRINPRYFVPVVPFLIAGVFMGLQVWSNVGWLKIPTKVLAIAFTVTILLANLPIYAYDVYVMRSGPLFYDRYQAGSTRNLVDAAHMLTRSPIDAGDRDIAINELYSNLGRQSTSKFGVRATHLLTDRVIQPIPKKRARRHPSGINGWLESNNARFYLYQQPYMPWMVWHLRLSESIQMRITGQDEIAQSGGWVLFRHSFDEGLRTMEIERAPDNWPHRVPGLE